MERGPVTRERGYNGGGASVGERRCRGGVKFFWTNYDEVFQAGYENDS